MISQADQLAGQAKIRAQQEMDQVNERNIGKQIENAKPMTVVAGPVGPAINGVKRTVIGENPDLLKKTAHLRAKNETLLAFMARTGISVHQIVNYTRRDLDNLYAVAKLNEMPEPKRSPIPNKFTVTAECHAADSHIDGHLAKNNLPPNMVEVGI